MVQSSGPTSYPGTGPVPYDDAWPGRFRQAAAGLSAVLGDGWLVEHVGSTSVPGLAAKPVIDLAVRVPGGSARATSTGCSPRPVGSRSRRR